MRYTLQQVRDSLRTREGQRVFFLGEGDSLSWEAQDYLNREKIPVRPGSEAKITRYRGLDGCWYEEKPEHMTQLTGDILVPKTHPRIVFRGMLDSLESQLIVLALEEPALEKEWGEMLDFVRRMLRCEVLEEPLPEGRLLGYSQQELRTYSQLPQKYLGVAHFMPEPKHGWTIARLNRLRTQVRQTELAAAAAFENQRQDMIRGLNRLSSLVYILMLKELARKEGKP